MLDFLIYPLSLSVGAGLFAFLLAQGVLPPLAASLPIWMLGILILCLERWHGQREEWRARRADVLADLAYMVLIQGFFPQLLMQLTFRSVQAVGSLELWPQDWPFLLQLLFMVVLVDLGRYGLHRAAHRFDILWRFHKVHHSPDILYILNVGRFHPFEKLLHFTLDAAVFAWLGVSPELLASYGLVYGMNGLFQHSNIRLRYGFLNYIVASAEAHRWHHARDPQVAQCNFSSTLILWDLVFGSFYLPKGQAVGPIGLEQRRYPKGFLRQLLQPFRREAPDL